MSSNPNAVPCQPIRTLRWWNGTIQITVTLATLLAVSLVWSNLAAKRMIAPGPLSASHAQLLVSSSTLHDRKKIVEIDRCSACHPGIGDTSSGQFVSHSADRPVAQTQSKLCLNCHSEKMPDSVHGSPHDLTGQSLDELVARGDRLGKKSLLKGLPNRSPIDWKENDMGCSQCHREHQGEMHSLQSMASARCQACHRNQFQSFSKDHPEFQGYPHGGARNITFDHISHRDSHFTKKTTEFDCKTCHIQSDRVGVVGQIFRSVSFERACASCHSESIKSASQDGLIVLQLPSVDRRLLRSYGLDVGDWPVQASQMNDGVIPTIMRSLFEAEDGGTELLKKLPKSGNLADMNMADVEQRESLVLLVEMTRKMMKKYANQGQPGIRSSVERLVSKSPFNAFYSGASVGAPASNSVWLDGISRGVPPDLFRAAYIEWFDDSKLAPIVSRNSQASPAHVRLSSQIQPPQDDLLSGSIGLIHQNGNDELLDNTADSLLLPSANPTPTFFEDPKAWNQLSYGGWMIDRQRMAIAYIPQGHADEWLSRCVELEQVLSESQMNSATHAESKPISLTQQCRLCHVLQPDEAIIHSEHGASWTAAFKQANRPSMRSQLIMSQSHENECWRSRRRAVNLTYITKFDHTPHLSILSINDCQSCHVLQSRGATNGIEFGNSQHEFAPIVRSQCAGCHQPNGAGESCTQCHNYHVGIKSWLEGRK